ncbi:MAG: fumarate hydratase [archaeon]|nr:fumarate hydratase [archaeon]
MDLINKAQKAVINASTNISKDRMNAFKRALAIEENNGNLNAVWALEQMIANFDVANEKKLPLCDDTGIPHVIVEVGSDREIPFNFFKDIKEGIAKGLDNLPARPMAVKGNFIERIEQSCGLFEEASALKPVSFLFEQKDESTYGVNLGKTPDKIKVHIILQGGGPEIRGKTYRVYHKRSFDNVISEATNWLKDSLSMLGCTPSIPSIGIGRSHFEANSLMLRAMVHGNLDTLSSIEKEVTAECNKLGIGPMGLGGNSTVLGTFINVGNQRASGVRIVATRPACFVEPRIASFEF